MANEVPSCGICKKGLRHGENHGRVRLAVEDMVDQKYPHDKKPGLYQSCPDCFETYQAVIAKRLGKKVEDMAAHDTI